MGGYTLFTINFDPTTIILGVAAFLLLLLVYLCFKIVKKALDIANQDKVVVF